MDRRQASLAEAGLASAISAALDGLSVGSEVPLSADSDICACLERFIPEVLARTYVEWSGESLDGVFVARATKVGLRRLRVLGTGILINDQAATPLQVELQASPTEEVIEEYLIQVGEPGEGSLGISGPPCNSGAATRLLHRLAGREELGRIDWVYELASTRGDS